MEDKYDYLADQSPLNQSQYAAKDYPSYFDALLSRLRDEFGDDYTDFGSSSVGMILINIMSYGLSQLSWYMDRTASDCYLDSARTLTPVTKLARQIGYKVKPAAAATADLSVVWADPTTAPSTIHTGFKFVGPEGLSFVATADVLVPIGATGATVNVTEGRFDTSSFTGDGKPNQSYALSGTDGVLKFLADTSVRVFVNGLEWGEAAFLDFEKTPQFEVVYTTVPPTIHFGDGFAGSIPPDGSDIRVEYTVIRGSGGNVKSNTITKASDPFQVAGVTIPFDTVSHEHGSSGGAGPQSIASVKALAPKVFQSRGAAVTQQDYEALSTAFTDPTYGSVSVGFAACVRDAFIDADLAAMIDRSQEASTAWAAYIAAAGVTTASYEESIDLNVALIVDTVGQISVIHNAIYTTATTGEASAGASKGKAAAALGMLDHSLSMTTNTETKIDEALAVGGLPAAAITALNDAKAALSGANSSINSAKTEMAGLEVAFGSAEAGFHDIWGANCASLETAYQSITTGGPGPPAGAGPVWQIGEAVDNIGATRVAVETASGIYHGVISTDTQAVEDWLSAYFSNDCKANVVNVKALVKNSDGFFVGPSTGLLKALQVYLDKIKEITHQVFVSSGGDAVLGADIDISVEYDPTFVKAEVLSNLEAGVDAILKGRRFNVPLYLSDVYSIVEGVAGVRRANIIITGPAGRVDSKGNLVPLELEIVSKGTVVVTEVAS